MQTRTTTPDQYSAYVRDLVRGWRAGRISPGTFATMIGMIWELRRARA